MIGKIWDSELCSDRPPPRSLDSPPVLPLLLLSQRCALASPLLGSTAGDSWPGCAGNPSHLHRNHSSQTGVAMRGERKVGNVPVWGLSWTSLGGLGALDSRRSDQQILILYLRCLLQAST